MAEKKDDFLEKAKAEAKKVTEEVAGKARDVREHLAEAFKGGTHPMDPGELHHDHEKE